MPTFRKKPVVIEAHQFHGSSSEIPAFEDWMHGLPFPDHGGIGTADVTTFTIPTLEGDMLVRAGWWVIKGVKGEFYPCEPVIFDATYEQEN